MLESSWTEQLLTQLTGRNIVLASQSPRRRQLLETLPIQFQVRVPDASAEPDDAQPMQGESIAEFVIRLACQKASSVANMLTVSSLIIGCDTVADLDGQVLGKPRDRLHASTMLRQLSGRTHRVWSGLCVLDSHSGKRWTVADESCLQMIPLTPEQLDSYLDSNEWQGKSGAFGYQDGHAWLKLVSGTADNVVGLPLHTLGLLLQQAVS